MLACLPACCLPACCLPACCLPACCLPACLLVACLLACLLLACLLLASVTRGKGSGCACSARFAAWLLSAHCAVLCAPPRPAPVFLRYALRGTPQDRVVLARIRPTRRISWQRIDATGAAHWAAIHCCLLLVLRRPLLVACCLLLVACRLLAWVSAGRAAGRCPACPRAGRGSFGGP